MNKWTITSPYKSRKDTSCVELEDSGWEKKPIKSKTIRDSDIRKCYKKHWNGDIHSKS